MSPIFIPFHSVKQDIFLFEHLIDHQLNGKGTYLVVYRFVQLFCEDSKHILATS